MHSSPDSLNRLIKTRWLCVSTSTEFVCAFCAVEQTEVFLCSFSQIILFLLGDANSACTAITAMKRWSHGWLQAFGNVVGPKK